MAKNLLTKEDIAKSKTPEALAKAKASRDRTYRERAVRTAVLEAISNELLDEQKNGKPLYQDLIAMYFKAAKENPNSSSGQLVASALISKDVLVTIDEQHEKNMSRDLDFIRFRISKRLFASQREVLLETHTSKKICVMCSRRAGKTDLASTLVNYVTIKPRSHAFYINKSFKNAINQVWDLAISIANDCGLHIEKEQKSDGIITFSNGSTIHFLGNSDNAQADKIRGYKANLVIIDEAGHQRNMNYLVNDVVEPMTVDYVDSTIILLGTPPRTPKTFFEHAWNSTEWTNFTWTMMDNPFIPNAKQAIEDIANSKGLTIDSPLIQREYLGRLVYDTEAMVFKGYNTFESEVTISNHDRMYEAPEGFVADKYYVGVDFGFSDYNSVIGLAINTVTQESCVLFESKFNKSTVTEIINSVISAVDFGKGILLKNPTANPNGIMIFCDTNEKSIAYEMAVTYKLPAHNAYKYDKSFALEQVAEETRIGKLLVPQGGILEDEFEQLVYKRGEDDSILPEVDDELFHGEACDSLLYASRSMFVDYGRDGHKVGKDVTDN